MKYYNIVFCRHIGNPKPYIFRLPLDREVKEGDRLAAVTAQGFQNNLTALSFNMMVSTRSAKALTKVVGGTWPLVEICGTVTTEYQAVTKVNMFTEDELPEDELPY